MACLQCCFLLRRALRWQSCVKDGVNHQSAFAQSMAAADLGGKNADLGSVFPRHEKAAAAAVCSEGERK